MADKVAELQLFVEIVRAGNLSAAARALNASPAAMSRGLSALESRLGVRLVTRTSRTFEPESQFARTPAKNKIA
jgi:DNA-binding transcriptional LysR family regulator